MIKYNNKTINDWDFGTSNIKKVYRNNSVCYYKISGTSPRVPSGWTEIEYVETPTTSPYCGIELLTIPSSTSAPMYYEVDFMVDTAVDQRILDLNRNSRFAFFANYPYCDDSGYRMFTLTFSDIPLATRNHIGFGAYSGDSGMYEIRNLNTDTRIAQTSHNIVNSLIPSVCAANYTQNVSGNASVNDEYSVGVRYYSIKIYDNNVLVGDYIPVRRNSDNFVTLYDSISNGFCSIIGEGALIGGSAI